MTDSLHIAIISPLQRKPGRTQGGLESVVTHLANALTHRGNQLDILVMPPPGGNPFPPGLDKEISVVHLKSKHKLIGLFTLANYLRKTRPDVLLAAGHRSNMLAIRAAHLVHSPPLVILSVHNTLSRQMSQFKPLKRWMRTQLIRRNYPAADAVIAVSRGVEDDLRNHFGLPASKLHTIHNPVVTDTLFQRAREPLNHPWFGPDQPPVIVSVGRLRPQKDYITLIRAFHRLRQRRNCRLIILGEGKERPILENLIKELKLQQDVQLPGFVANPLPYMREAALFVLSSAWEGFGNVLVEAMATGVPVVATDCPSGPREILENGRHGPLVPVGDIQALASAMHKTLDTPPDRENLINAARRFDVDHATSAYSTLLQRLVKRRRNLRAGDQP